MALNFVLYLLERMMPTGMQVIFDQVKAPTQDRFRNSASRKIVSTRFRTNACAEAVNEGQRLER